MAKPKVVRRDDGFHADKIVLPDDNASNLQTPHIAGWGLGMWCSEVRSSLAADYSKKPNRLSCPAGMRYHQHNAD